jgi:hypothetical protein
VSSEKEMALFRERAAIVGPEAASLSWAIDRIQQPSTFHTHVCPHCTQSRDCNCATEPDTVWSVCEDCLGVSNV